jgi:hypothetical protein
MAAAATDAGCFSLVCPSVIRSDRNVAITAVASFQKLQVGQPEVAAESVRQLLRRDHLFHHLRVQVRRWL